MALFLPGKKVSPAVQFPKRICAPGEAVELYLSPFLMKNLQFLHCRRANGTVAHDSQSMKFDSSSMFLTNTSCTALSIMESSLLRCSLYQGSECSHSRPGLHLVSAFRPVSREMSVESKYDYTGLNPLRTK